MVAASQHEDEVLGRGEIEGQAADVDRREVRQGNDADERDLDLVRIPDVVDDVDLVLGRFVLRRRGRHGIAGHLGRGGAVLLCGERGPRGERRDEETRDHPSETRHCSPACSRIATIPSTSSSPTRTATIVTSIGTASRSGAGISAKAASPTTVKRTSIPNPQTGRNLSVPIARRVHHPNGL